MTSLLQHQQETLICNYNYFDFACTLFQHIALFVGAFFFQVIGQGYGGFKMVIGDLNGTLKVRINKQEN